MIDNNKLYAAFSKIDQPVTAFGTRTWGEAAVHIMRLFRQLDIPMATKERPKHL